MHSLRRLHPVHFTCGLAGCFGSWLSCIPKVDRISGTRNGILSKIETSWPEVLFCSTCPDVCPPLSTRGQLAVRRIFHPAEEGSSKRCHPQRLRDGHAPTPWCLLPLFHSLSSTASLPRPLFQFLRFFFYFFKSSCGRD
jgi:hypothetical protein